MSSQKITCNRCHNKILQKYAKSFEGKFYSRQCYAKAFPNKKKQVPCLAEVAPSQVKTPFQLEIEAEEQIYELEKKRLEEQQLERCFSDPKQENKENVLKVLNDLCFGMLGQSLAEVMV